MTAKTQRNEAMGWLEVGYFVILVFRTYSKLVLRPVGDRAYNFFEETSIL